MASIIIIIIIRKRKSCSLSFWIKNIVSGCFIKVQLLHLLLVYREAVAVF